MIVFIFRGIRHDWQSCRVAKEKKDERRAEGGSSDKIREGYVDGCVY